MRYFGHPAIRTVAFGLAVVSSVAVTTFLLLTWIGVWDKGGSASGLAGAGLTGNGLIVEGRDRLEICVDYSQGTAAVLSTPASNELAKSRVESALADVQSHPFWGPSGLGDDPLVVVGCPAPAVALLPDAHLIAQGGKGYFSGAVPVVDQPSLFREFIFVLDDATYIQLFTHEPPIMEQEFITQGDQGIPVTYALYLSTSQLEDHAYLVEWLKKALGLEHILSPNGSQ